MPLIPETRDIVFDFAWANDSEHQGAEAYIVSRLLRAGWEEIHATDVTRTLQPPDGAPFEEALRKAQHLVGQQLVTEADRRS
ncbi:MAG TPA: hypothetical protein VES65_01810 [Solirubrobacteraceae bacterium]|nr:hypothetical protein [Solirubrobacteraceae bacterium]